MAWIGAGWVLAALAEATAYTVRAFAIRDRGGVLPVLVAVYGKRHALGHGE